MGKLLCILMVALSLPTARAEEPVRVFAAASLTDALNEVGSRWEKAGHPPPGLAFAASSALARQIEHGAPADLFASADPAWMDYLESRGKLDAPSRVSFLGNGLVLVAPRGRAFTVKMEKGFDAAAAFEGKLCTGEPGVVPVGKYAREALESLGWWASLQGRVVGTDDVRSALAFVERGECAAGIVYATDATATSKVEVVGTFPAGTHKPIVYPFALVRGARPEAARFLEYLRESREVAALFEARGFKLLTR
jgi:molybdate transport system substrate-binding protein